jgi:hypothetical protein
LIRNKLVEHCTRAAKHNVAEARTVRAENKSCFVEKPDLLVNSQSTWNDRLDSSFDEILNKSIFVCHRTAGRVEAPHVDPALGPLATALLWTASSTNYPVEHTPPQL